MVLDKLFDLLAPDEPVPNKFTIYMGEKIRDGRIEAGMSQQDLARLIYKRQAALSDYENGKAIVNADTLALLAHNLNKPIEYFYPPYTFRDLKPEDLSPMEKEVITNLRYHVASDQFRKLVIDVIKAIGKFDIDTFVVEQYPISKNIVEHKKELERRTKKK
jgi:transcriptional regulator with XRE-family HTH domain